MTAKKDFENAYRKFSPEGMELFFIKYFSINSLYEHRWIGIITSLALAFPMLFLIIRRILELPCIYVKEVNILYMIALGIVSIHLLFIFLRRLNRYKKIRNYLGISKKEFKELVDAYYLKKKYISTEEYIKQNTK